MSDIKLVAVDMDATLLDSKKRLPADFIPWVKSHPSIRTVIASGDQYWALRRYMPEIGDDLIFISENGGLVFDKGELIYKDAISRDDLEHYLSICEGMDDGLPGLCGLENAYFPASANDETKKVLGVFNDHLKFVDDLLPCADEDVIAEMSVYFAKHNAEEYYRFFKDQSDTTTAYVSAPEWIDVMNKSNNKGTALKFIQKKYGIDPSECMAFGDYMNDKTMLMACGESYAMANAHPDIKAIAKHQTASNDEDGVMKILRQIPEG